MSRQMRCSYPLGFESALAPEAWAERLRNIRPNAGMMEKSSLCRLGPLEFGDPIELDQQVGTLAKRYPHIDLWVDCCGTWETHLEEVTKNIGT